MGFAALPLIIAGAGTALSAGGQQAAGEAAKHAADEEAVGTLAEAKLQAIKIRKLAREYRGAARADYAASGVVVDEGSPLIAEREIVQRSEEDALFTLSGGERRARAIRAQGKAYKQAAALGAAGTALSFGGQMMGGGWQRYAGGQT